MFDTHAHVQDAVFDADRKEMLARARAAGVTRIMTIGTDIADSRRAQATAAAYGLKYAIGIHPHEAEDAPEDIAAALDAVVADGAAPPAAIGEMGLDYYYEHSPKDTQRRVLVAQLAYALERDLPAVFHQRDAFDDFVAIVRDVAAGPVRGVVHCFTGEPDQARTLVDAFGLRLGIGGVLTFKTAQNVRDSVLAVGLDKLILETDCPYLAPVPHRGRRNEPAFMAATAELLAKLFETTVDDVVSRTDETARALLGD
jgi:TatD DNase family protein